MSEVIKRRLLCSASTLQSVRQWCGAEHRWSAVSLSFGLMRMIASPRWSATLGLFRNLAALLRRPLALQPGKRRRMRAAAEPAR